MKSRTKLADPEDQKYDIIDKAPTEPVDIDTTTDEDDVERELIGTLQDQLAETQAELESERASRLIERTKAELMKPLLVRVYNLVAAYCAFILILAALQGFSIFGFELEEMILAILSGSTAVSVIGLIGMLISGVFSGSKQAD